MTLFPSYQYNDIGINSTLYELIEKNPYQQIKGYATRTSFTFGIDHRDVKQLDDLLTWIEKLIPMVSFYYANGGDKVDYDPDSCGFDVSKFKIRECWGIIYNKGEGVILHNHFPYPLSFVYYVKVPEGSSPLILNNQELFLPEGRVVFFLGHLFHGILPNECDGRCIIAGNISYEFPNNSK